MRRQSTVWLVAALIVTLAAVGTIYVRMDIPEGENLFKAKGSAPAGIQLTGARAARGPLQYAPIAATMVMAEDHILAPGSFPGAAPARAVGEPESPIGERMALRLRRRAMRQRLTNGVDAGASVPPLLDPPGVSITSYQDGPDGDTNSPVILVPPDPELAAGPDHLVSVVNISFGFHDKVGGVPTFVDAESFFTANPDCPGSVFDPDVVYDEDAGRFVMGYDAGGTHYCVAFSDDSDPFGGWFLYAFPTAAGGEFFDFPHMGVGPECIGLGSNMFAGGFVGSDVWCMKKADGYAGAPLTVVMGTTGFSSTPQFANLHGSDLTTTGPDHFILTDDVFDGQTFGVFKWDALGVGGDPVMVSAQGWTPGGGGFPITTPQSGAEGLAGNDWRIPSHPEQRDGYIWPTATVSANPSGGAVVNCFQWAQYDTVSDSVIQGGLTCPDTNVDPDRNAIFADGAVNACGDFFVGFTRSQSTDDPGTSVCGRRGSTALNSMRCGKGIKPGDEPYFAFDGEPLRWGDYTGMAADPNGEDFWYLGEYAKTGLVNGVVNWGTNIGSITTDCVP